MTEIAAGLKAERRRASVILRQGNNTVELLDAELPAVIDYLTRVLKMGQSVIAEEARQRQAEMAQNVSAARRRALNEICTVPRPRLSTLEETETGTHWTDRDERSFVSQPE